MHPDEKGQGGAMEGVHLKYALWCGAEDPDYIPRLTLTLEESRNDLCAIATPLFVSIEWSVRDT
jgi:hypothetical protein